MHPIVIPPAIRGLIFDCDGTLADTHPLHQEAWDECLSALGVPTPPHFLDPYKGVPTPRIIEIFNQRFGTRLDPIAVAEDKERRAMAKLDRSQPVDRVVAVAHRYKGVLPMAVASGGTRENVLVTLTAIGMADFFDAVLGAQDAPRGKPHPDIFLAAAQRLNVAPSLCLVLEDSPLGMEAAAKAGMAAIDVTAAPE